MTTSNTGRIRKPRQREAIQLTDALTRAQVALMQAQSAWGMWADTVRQQAEAAHGAGYIEADPVIPNDGQYRDALDLGGELDQALTDATALIDRLRQAEQTRTSSCWPGRATNKL
jgi:hypothetical protein